MWDPFHFYVRKAKSPPRSPETRELLDARVWRCVTVASLDKKRASIMAGYPISFIPFCITLKRAHKTGNDEYAVVSSFLCYICSPVTWIFWCKGGFYRTFWWQKLPLYNECFQERYRQRLTDSNRDIRCSPLAFNAPRRPLMLKYDDCTLISTIFWRNVHFSVSVSAAPANSILVDGTMDSPWLDATHKKCDYMSNYTIETFDLSQQMWWYGHWTWDKSPFD